jgi:hypothetical protein
VDVSPVMGKGFPADTVPPEKVSTIILFATGSGISPVKALIESGALEVCLLFARHCELRNNIWPLTIEMSYVSFGINLSLFSSKGAGWVA